MPSTTKEKPVRSRYSFMGGSKKNDAEETPSSPAEVVTLKPAVDLEELKTAFDKRFTDETLRDVEYELVPTGLALTVHSIADTEERTDTAVRVEDRYRTYLYETGTFDEMFSKPSHHDAKSDGK